MRRADFSYPLPQDLIADRPLPRRGASRLLALDGATGAIRDLAFDDFGGLLEAGDVVVLNDTRVLPARLRGRKASGGACELLLERVLDGRRILAQARASKGIRAGTRIELPAGASAVAIARHGDLYELELDREALPYFESHGSVPLPPYVAREADDSDRERYQTVYARVPGAVAAAPERSRRCAWTKSRSTACTRSGSGFRSRPSTRLRRRRGARAAWSPSARPWCVRSRPRHPAAGSRRSMARRTSSYAPATGSASSTRC